MNISSPAFSSISSLPPPQPPAVRDSGEPVVQSANPPPPPPRPLPNESGLNGSGLSGQSVFDARATEEQAEDDASISGLDLDDGEETSVLTTADEAAQADEAEAAATPLSSEEVPPEARHSSPNDFVKQAAPMPMDEKPQSVAESIVQAQIQAKGDGAGAINAGVTEQYSKLLDAVS